MRHASRRPIRLPARTAARAARAASPLLSAVLIAACASAATPAPTSPPASAPASPSPTVSASAASSSAASPAASGASLPQLAGTWTVVASNPRVVTATGGDAGGSVTITGTRFKFAKGDSRSSEGPIDFAAVLTLDCNATRCRVTGSTPGYEIRMDGGDLALLFSATLKRYGTGQPCSLPDLPGAGRITITRTGMVAGSEVPTEVRLTGGYASGLGTNCSQSSFEVAWDLVGTRQP